MAVVNKFNVNSEQVTLDADIIENMSANDVSYDDSFQYKENTVGNKLSELESKNEILGLSPIYGYNYGHLGSSIRKDLPLFDVGEYAIKLSADNDFGVVLRLYVGDSIVSSEFITNDGQEHNFSVTPNITNVCFVTSSINSSNNSQVEVYRRNVLDLIEENKAKSNILEGDIQEANRNIGEMNGTLTDIENKLGGGVYSANWGTVGASVLKNLPLLPVGTYKVKFSAGGVFNANLRLYDNSTLVRYYEIYDLDEHIFEITEDITSISVYTTSINSSTNTIIRIYQDTIFDKVDNNSEEINKVSNAVSVVESKLMSTNKYDLNLNDYVVDGKYVNTGTKVWTDNIHVQSLIIPLKEVSKVFIGLNDRGRGATIYAFLDSDETTILTSGIEISQSNEINVPSNAHYITIFYKYENRFDVSSVSIFKTLIDYPRFESGERVRDIEITGTTGDGEDKLISQKGITKLLEPLNTLNSVAYSNKVVICPEDFEGATMAEKVKNANSFILEGKGNYTLYFGKGATESNHKTYLINESIVVPSNTTIYVENSTIQMADNTIDNMFRSANIIINPNDRQGFALNKDAEVDILSNIRIIGKNATLLMEENANVYGAPNIGWLGCTCFMFAVENFEFCGFTIVKNILWSVAWYDCRYGKIHDLVFNTTRTNGDGVDISGHDISIYNISGMTEDDTIAIGSCTSKRLDIRPHERTIPVLPFNYDNHPIGGDCYNIFIDNIDCKGYNGSGSCVDLVPQGFKIHDIYMSNLISGEKRPCAFMLWDGYGGMSKDGDVYNLFANTITEKVNNTYGALCFRKGIPHNSHFNNVRYVTKLYSAVDVVDDFESVGFQITNYSNTQ